MSNVDMRAAIKFAGRFRTSIDLCFSAAAVFNHEHVSCRSVFVHIESFDDTPDIALRRFFVTWSPRK